MADWIIANAEPDCPRCAPLGCDCADGDHPRDAALFADVLPGCHCGAKYDGRDCMCFEGVY